MNFPKDIYMIYNPANDKYCYSLSGQSMFTSLTGAKLSRRAIRKRICQEHLVIHRYLLTGYTEVKE